MPFTKGNTYGVKGRPVGIKSQAQQLKAYLIKLLMTDKAALKKIPKKELLKCIAPLLPKEQTIHQDTEPITINIDTKKDEKLMIESNTPTNARLTDEVLNNKVNEINTASLNDKQAIDKDE